MNKMQSFTLGALPRGLCQALVCTVLVIGATPCVQAQSGQQDYHLAQGELSQVLTRFAAQAGIVLSFDARLTRGLSSPGLDGRYDVESGLRQLLHGRGLQPVRESDGRYSLQPVSSTGALELGATQIDSRLLGATTEGSGSYTTGSMSTATRMGLSMRETPQSVTVISRQRMNDQDMKTLEDVVKGTPGVIVRKDGPQQLSFTARGFEVDNMMFDGLPTTYLGYISPSDNMAIYDRVEVVRGATGMMQGAGNPSAAINLVRKRPTREPRVSLTGSAGSWDAYRGELDASGALNTEGSVRGRVVTAYQEKDSFQDKVDADFSLLYAIGEVDLTESTTAMLGASYEKNHNRTTWSGMPVAADGHDLGLSRSTYLGDDWEFWDRSSTSVFAEIDHRFDNGWKLRLALNKSWSQMDYLATALAVQNGARNLNAARYHYSYDQQSYDLYASGPLRLFDREHELVVGANRRSALRDMEGGQNLRVASNIDIYNWKGGTASPTVPHMFTLGEEITQQGVYVSSRFDLADSLKLIVGSRLDWYDYDALYADTHQKENRHVTRYGGLIQDLDEHHSVYVSYTDIFKPQTSLGVDGRPIKPIEGKNYELGIKGEYFDGALNASAAVFQIDQLNRAKNLDDPSQCPGYPINSCAQAAGKVRSQGVDLEISGAFTPAWQVAAGYTFTQTEYKSDSNPANVGTLLDSRNPRHLFKLSSTYHLSGDWRQWRVGASVYRQSAIFSKGTSNGVLYHIEQQPYTLVNLMLGYRISEHLDTQLNFNNVLDQKYYQSISLTTVNARNLYGEPRNATLTARYEF